MESRGCKEGTQLACAECTAQHGLYGREEEQPEDEVLYNTDRIQFKVLTTLPLTIKFLGQKLKI